MYVASERVWASHTPTVNGQGLYSISALKKYGPVTHLQSTDRVYTAFRLLESMGKLLTHSKRILVVHMQTLFVCLQSLNCVVMLKLFLCST